MFKSTLRFATLLLGAACATAHAQNTWQEIDAPAPFVDSAGVQRAPSCSGGPELVDSPLGPVPVEADTSFSFFVRLGDPDKLAIVWDGGGACWDANTCIGSALTSSATYNLSVDETAAELDAAPGIGDVSNPANPLRDYTQVFIPYCTADLHAGAADRLYEYLAPDGSVIPWTIHHRGFDNVVAVLEWVRSYYEEDVGRAPSRVFLAGASAGGYGVLYAYPHVARLLPRGTRTRVLVDAANGVMTEDFYERVLTPGGSWAVWVNMAPELAGAFSSGADELMIETFASLGAHYPNTRFGQYTTAYDAVQIFFYNVARHPDAPQRWLDPVELLLAGFDWTLRARTYMWLSAFRTWNYRLYIAKGADHTVVADDKYYSENSADGVYFSDWVDDMINRFWPWWSDWRNVSCFPDCLP